MSLNGIRGGLAGKILRVDLSTGRTSTEDTEKYAERFIGGRAVNSYILLNEMDLKTNWSDPENMLIFGVGCLVGTIAPSACRVSIDTKNVFNNGKGSANVGGDFGAELRYAGFDHLVITGKSEDPVYLWINDGTLELRDAGYIWGRTTYDTEAIIRKQLGDDKIKVACIGPAGENLVKGSSIIVDCAKAAAGSGVGCVMGSKRLKAVAVRGRGAIKVAEPDRFLDVVRRSLVKVKGSPRAMPMRQGNIEADYFPESHLWDVAAMVRNGQDEFWPMEKRINLVGKDTGVPKYKKGMSACVACPVGCMPFLEIDEGKYQGTKGTGYWINSALYSERFDVDDPAASLKFHLMANQLGLDGDFASVVLSWAFECYEKELINKDDTGGLELEWGSEDAMIKLEKKLAYREGIGDLLAEGVREASKRLGKGSENFALHMKGQDTVDPYRVMKGFGLGVSTSLVSGRHLRGAVVGPGLSGPKDLDFPPTQYRNQAEAVFWQLRAKEIEDLTGLCVYIGSFTGAHALEPADYAELINSAMGVNLTEQDLMLIGRCGYNLEKAFNTIHAGFSRKDDLPPRRYLEEPVKSGPFAGFRCEREEWEKMLDEFYAFNGWDRETSLQTRQGLEELGMEDIAKILEKADKLIG